MNIEEVSQIYRLSNVSFLMNMSWHFIGKNHHGSVPQACRFLHLETPRTLLIYELKLKMFTLQVVVEICTTVPSIESNCIREHFLQRLRHCKPSYPFTPMTNIGRGAEFLSQTNSHLTVS